jgi:hypothetical protein
MKSNPEHAWARPRAGRSCRIVVRFPKDVIEKHAYRTPGTQGASDRSARVSSTLSGFELVG